ncbi:NADH-quinone oxidoreductase subunit NuoH [Haloferula sp. A504]|uniref:NADH-quinone oxidoreductase subunit NuoH n=1 Tax=Haloferula sp. A504 TaxID=3373601 RepID=UPI0031CB44C5|nr:NADH-quinone oxidoreductase subunit NuoH [Verrucomicrobiaceae bacterium E54]
MKTLIAQAAEPSLWSPEWLPLLPKRLVENLLEHFNAPGWLVSIGGIAAGAATVLAVFMTAFALLSLIERKTLARAQNRIGPNRAGPFGILQPVADGIKMLTKEDIVPAKAEKLLHLLAPILIVIPAIMALGVLPYGREWTPVPLELGLLFFFALGALTEVSVFIAGWASGSKFPMLGAMRAISQMVSYELPLVLSAIAVIMVSGTLSLPEIVAHQGGYHLGFLPAWHILTPWGLVGGLVFFIASIGEANRCPFDLPEGESEIVAGHMTEYSGFKYALFFMGEYLGLFAISGLGVTLFLGGWQAPFPGLGFVPSWIWFFAKLAAVIFLFLWIRATFPRLRMDQLMRFGWLALIPMSLLTIPAAGIWTLLHRAGHGLIAWVVTIALLVVPFVIMTVLFNRGLARSNRTYRFAES